MFDKVSSFLDEIISEIESVGIDVNGLTIDHIAYSTDSSSQYEVTLPAFTKNGKLLKEAIIGDRRVAVISLNNPIIYKNHSISIVELIEPKEGQKTFDGWEHVEFLVNGYEEMLNKYPNLNWDTDNMNRESFSRIKLVLPSKREVKFLNTPVLESVKEKNN